MNDRHKDFADFCRLVLGDKEPNGQIVGNLLEAYLRLGVDSRAAVPQRPATLDFSKPWQVYEIRNLRTGRVYVGRAAKGFALRYPREWWEGHHSLALTNDIVLHGLATFGVNVFQCVDAADMCTLERLMYDAAPLKYNEIAPPEDPSVE